MKDKKKILFLTSLIVAGTMVLAAFIFKVVDMARGTNDAYSIGRFFTSFLFFAAAIMAILLRKELVGILILIFAEVIPHSSLFIQNANAMSFKNAISFDIYGFMSLFFFAGLVILLIFVALNIKYERTPVERKWIFIPPALVFALYFIFQGIYLSYPIMAFSLFIAIIVPLLYGLPILGAIIAFASLVEVPFHLGASLNINVNPPYWIAFWVFGFTMLLLSAAWLVFEIMLLVKEKGASLKVDFSVFKKDKKDPLNNNEDNKLQEEITEQENLEEESE